MALQALEEEISEQEVSGWNLNQKVDLENPRIQLALKLLQPPKLQQHMQGLALKNRYQWQRLKLRIAGLDGSYSAEAYFLEELEEGVGIEMMVKTTDDDGEKLN